jgi:dihydropteroate synthase
MLLNCRGKLLDLNSPKVMGILNLTPDSFFDGGKYSDEKTVLLQAEKMILEGASILDIGGMSSRPGSKLTTPDEELSRIMVHVKNIIEKFPETIVSVDTIHSNVAEKVLQAGVHIINDITAARFDENMLTVVAKHSVPFVSMHMQGMPHNMQQQPTYENVVAEVIDFFAERLIKCYAAGIKDVILDVGFGFGKTIEHNYTLLRNLSYFKQLNAPILVGVSRKSMITKLLNVTAAEALNGTSVLNALAIINGADILRVHDVKEAVEVLKIATAYEGRT